MSALAQELSRPIANTPPVGFVGRLKFYGRFALDLQVATVYRDLRKVLPTLRGEVLDVGCGMSPYRSLLDPAATRYTGIDVVDEGTFANSNDDVHYFDGLHIPFEACSFDGVICTEVLEHVPHFQQLVDEIQRVLKPGGRAVLTVPWSARCHYIPKDYFRYTPSALAIIFAKWGNADVEPRGTDISAIASKVAVLWWRNLVPRGPARLLTVPLALLLTPVVMAVMLVAHICLAGRLGDKSDPLGYTITATK